MKKKHKSLFYILTIDLYTTDVVFSLGQTDEELKKSLKPCKVEDDEFHKLKFSSADNPGFCYELKCGSRMVRLKALPNTPEQFGWLQHEIFHAACFLLDKKGFKFEIMVSDEAYSYLIQFLTVKIMAQINKCYYTK